MGVCLEMTCNHCGHTWNNYYGFGAEHGTALHCETCGKTFFVTGPNIKHCTCGGRLVAEPDDYICPNCHLHTGLKTLDGDLVGMWELLIGKFE